MVAAVPVRFVILPSVELIVVMVAAVPVRFVILPSVLLRVVNVETPVIDIPFEDVFPIVKTVFNPAVLGRLRRPLPSP